jgi:hypothetical protein
LRLVKAAGMHRDPGFPGFFCTVFLHGFFIILADCHRGRKKNRTRR